MASTAPSSKIHPYLTQLHYSTDGGANYTQLFDLQLATPPDLKRDSAETTVLDSPGMIKESIASWIDAGEMPFTLYYTLTGAVFNTIYGFFTDGTIRYYKYVLPLASGGNTKANFILQGYLTGFKLSEAKAEGNDVYTNDVKIKIATGTGFAFSPGT